MIGPGTVLSLYSGHTAPGSSVFHRFLQCLHYEFINFYTICAKILTRAAAGGIINRLKNALRGHHKNGGLSESPGYYRRKT